jgi:hypothetical protein
LARRLEKAVQVLGLSAVRARRACHGPLLDIIEEDEGAIFHLQPQSPPVSGSGDGHPLAFRIEQRRTSGGILAPYAVFASD